jgi:hypothetical protein
MGCGVLTYVFDVLRRRRQRRIALGLPSLAFRFGRWCASQSLRFLNLSLRY